MPPPSLLLCDDDAVFRGLLAAELTRLGYEVVTVGSVAEALDRTLGIETFHFAVIDLNLPDGTGLDVLRHLRTHQPATEAILLTGHGTIDSAIEAMRSGAFDYLTKPCMLRELQIVLEKAAERRHLVERNAILTTGLHGTRPGQAFIGQSPALRHARELVERVAPTDASVLILGETGVGKEVVARHLHAASARSDKPFVVVDCTALQDDLLHNELFGHEKGAYTSAGERKHGLFEVADTGTIFLDEIGDLSPSLQQKLLRVLESGSFRHVGGTREIHVDVRLVAATNRNLADMVQRGYFRSDLYYRLGALHIEVPPLRDRHEDILPLARHFLARLDHRFGRRHVLTTAAEERLEGWRWPGNVRELVHVVEAAAVLCRNGEIGIDDLPPEVRDSAGASTRRFVTLEALERGHIVSVLRAVDGNRTQAAQILGISERTMYRKISEFGLDGPHE